MSCIFIFYVIQIIYFIGAASYLLYFIYQIFIRRSVLKPWQGYDLAKAQLIVKLFAVDYKDLDLAINRQIFVDNNKSIWRPCKGFYKSGLIFIDTRFVRNDKDFMQTLLHEICHYNQHKQGRLILGMEGSYDRRPIEREAEAFSKAWTKKALSIYRPSKSQFFMV